MKRALLSITLATVAVVMGGRQLSEAQKARPYSFFVNGSLGFALTPDQFNSYYNMGFGGGAGIEYPVSPNWSILGLIDFKTFKPSDSRIESWWSDPGEWPNTTFLKSSEGGVTATTIGVVSKGNLKSKGSTLFPYVKGGFGLSFTSASQVKITYVSDYPGSTEQVHWASVDGSNTNISILLGLGIEKTIGGGTSSIFLDAGIHMILYQDINPTLTPITLGLKF